MAQTILLVDDHRSVCAAVKTVLERAGHAVLEADKVTAVQEPRPPPDPAAGTPHPSG